MQFHPVTLLALAAVPFLFNTGLQVSGYSNFAVTVICWSLAGVILFLAGLEWVRKWHRSRWEKGLASLESWYFIIPCFLLAALLIAAAAFGLGQRSVTPASAATSVPFAYSKSAQQAVQNRPVFVKNPQISGGGLIAFRGVATITAPKLRIYVDHSWKIGDDSWSGRQRIFVQDIIDVVKDVRIEVKLTHAIDPAKKSRFAFHWGAEENAFVEEHPARLRISILKDGSDKEQHIYFELSPPRGDYVVNTTPHSDWASAWETE